MRITLAYGEEGLGIDVPEDTTVVRPANVPALGDEAGAITSAIDPCLDGLSLRGRTVAVVFPDITRPMPNRTVLPPLLAALERRGAGPDEVLLLCATGTHRSATDEELATLIGPELVATYRVKQHVAERDDHAEVGLVDGVPILIDADYIAADVRIVTGFVEPHFFAGFSGGPKAVCPGLAALATVLEAHSPTRIADPRATWTVLEGNPVHDFVRAATAYAPPDLSVDVAINDDRQVTAVFAGPLPDAHREACAFVERTNIQKVPGRVDVVVSTNGGHPLDRNLYQAVKGMAAAERVVTAGGTVLMAAECRDGLPSGSEFARLLASASTPQQLVHPDAGVADGWQTQVLGRVLTHAQVGLYTSGLSPEEIRQAQLTPIDDLNEAVTRSRGRLCVLPLGPLTVATAG